jgi:predicted RNA-binding Zn-ribbon protein involved in translation (DUF1610 family)
MTTLTKEWVSYWYVCTSCDASIEIVTRRTKNRAPRCTCKHSHVVLCQKSVADKKVVA